VGGAQSRVLPVLVYLFLSAPNTRAQPCRRDGLTHSGRPPRPRPRHPSLDGRTVRRKSSRLEIAKELGATQATPSPTPPPASRSRRVHSRPHRHLVTMRCSLAGFDGDKEEENWQSSRRRVTTQSRNGYTVQSVEVSFLGAVDPYLPGKEGGARGCFSSTRRARPTWSSKKRFSRRRLFPTGSSTRPGQFSHGDRTPQPDASAHLAHFVDPAGHH
jgi:hypothetical protein